MKGNRGRQKEMNEGAKRTKGEDRIERRGEKEQICFKFVAGGGLPVEEVEMQGGPEDG